jgi:hypothetical protein
MSTFPPPRTRRIRAAAGAGLALIALVSAPAAQAAPWGAGVTLTPAEAKSASKYPGELTPYPTEPMKGTHSIRVNGAKQNAETWFWSYYGSVDKAKGKEVAVPMSTGGQRWASGAIAKAAFAKEFNPGPDYGKVTVISGTPRSTTAVLMYEPDSGPQYFSAYQVKGQYLISVSCTRPFSVVGESGKPTVVTVAVRQGLRACVTALLAATAKKFP